MGILDILINMLCGLILKIVISVGERFNQLRTVVSLKREVYHRFLRLVHEELLICPVYY